MAKKNKEEKEGISDELQAALDAINASYGSGSIMSMTDSAIEAERVPTGSLTLDLVLDGGYPRSKIVEVYGPQAAGKSTITLHFLAQCKGPKLLIDCEQSFSREYAEALGVNLKNTFICQPSTLEEAGDILIKLLPNMEGVVFDSIAEATPKKELEGDMETESVGLKAKKMSQLMRLIKATEHTATILFVNQTRQTVGMSYGPTTTTPGGNAAKFSAHVRIDMYSTELIRKGSAENAEVIGHKINCRLNKYKLGTPHVKFQIPIIYNGKGVSREMEIIDLCLEAGYIIQSGSWFSTEDGTKLGQGSENVRLFLISNPEFAKELENKLKQ